MVDPPLQPRANSLLLDERVCAERVYAEMTKGQKLMKQAISDLTWARDMFEESDIPEAVNLELLITRIREALETSRDERLAAVAESRAKGRR